MGKGPNGWDVASMTAGEFYARSGLNSVYVHRLVKAGVLQPDRPDGPGRALPGVFTDADLVAAAVWANAGELLESARAVEAAVCSRFGSPYVLVFANAVVPATDLGEALYWMSRIGGACTLIDVAKVSDRALAPV